MVGMLHMTSVAYTAIIPPDLSVVKLLLTVKYFL